MNILGLDADQILTILQLGISGVAFIFLAMSFVLLRNEQARKGGPNDKMLGAIKQFSKLSLVFALVVAGVTLMDKFVTQEMAVSEQCSNALSSAKLLAGSDQQTLNSIRDLLTKTNNACE